MDKKNTLKNSTKFSMKKWKYHLIKKLKKLGTMKVTY